MVKIVAKVFNSSIWVILGLASHGCLFFENLLNVSVLCISSNFKICPGYLEYYEIWDLIKNPLENFELLNPLEIFGVNIQPFQLNSVHKSQSVFCVAVSPMSVWFLKPLHCYSGFSHMCQTGSSLEHDQRSAT